MVEVAFMIARLGILLVMVIMGRITWLYWLTARDDDPPPVINKPIETRRRRVKLKYKGWGRPTRVRDD